MNKSNFDLAVIGTGPAGYAAAIRASQLGKKAALIERDELGGVCLNKGCIPTKTFLEFVETREYINRVKDWGISVEVKNVDFQKFLERKAKIISVLINGLNKLLLSYKIEVYRGEASIVNSNMLTVKANNSVPQYIEAEKLIIASGSEPKKAAPFDLRDGNLLTSDEALQLEEVPRQIVIIGGGVIGCEFACIYSGLGAKVILVEIEDRFLPGEDKDIVRRLEAVFRMRHIEIYTGTTVEKLESRKDSLYLELSNGKTVSGEKVLISLGRKPNCRIDGVEKIGLKLAGGGIEVNERLETNLAGIYAAGDVLGGPFLAHSAYQQGIIAAENAFGGNGIVDKDNLPYCTYTLPEIGRVGLTEEAALKRGIKIKVGHYPFAGLSRAVIKNERQGLFKVISNETDGRIIGIHILGKGATDLIAEGVLALKSGLTAKELASVIHAHPTFCEGIRSAAEDINGEAIHLPPQSSLNKVLRKK